MSETVGNYVSLNMKYFKDVQLLKHNDRSDGINKDEYFLEEKDRRKNYLDKKSMSKFLKLKELAEDDMKKQRGKRKGGNRSFRKNSSTLVDCVLGLGRERTLEIINAHGIDKAHQAFNECIEKLVDDINKEMGLTFVCANGHFDEGHKESGKENFHYHLSFLNYDFLEHKTVMRQFRKGNKVWAKLQDLTANAFEPLNYIRGKEGSQAKGLSHQDFRRAREVAEKDIDKDSTMLEKKVAKGLSLDELSELKLKYGHSKLLKRIIDYAYRFQKLEEAEADLKKREKNIEHIENTVEKVLSNETLSYEEAELLSTMIENGYMKANGKVKARVSKVIHRKPRM